MKKKNFFKNVLFESNNCGIEMEDTSIQSAKMNHVYMQDSIKVCPMFCFGTQNLYDVLAACM